MASPKKLTVKCTAMSLLNDGRQRVTLIKAADTTTTKSASGATVVNPNDVELNLTADATESYYAIGREYSLQIT